MNKTIYMKIFLNYLQVISLSKGFNLNWPETIQSLFKAQGQVSQITQQILALDCFISCKIINKNFNLNYNSWIPNKRNLFQSNYCSINSIYYKFFNINNMVNCFNFTKKIFQK